MNWLFRDKPSRQFRSRVLRAAAVELKGSRAATDTLALLWRRRLILTGGLLALVSWMSFRRVKPVASVPEPELLADLDLLSHLEMLEDFDILEGWQSGDQNG
jgi:hypothetical protein